MYKFIDNNYPVCMVERNFCMTVHAQAYKVLILKLLCPRKLRILTGKPVDALAGGDAFGSG